MQHLKNWCDEGSYVHFDQPEAEVPPAKVLYDQLRVNGKLSKVLRPSEAHSAGELAGAAVPRLTGRIKPARGKAVEA